MIQNLSFTPIRSTTPINSKFLPVPQTDSGVGFRDVMAGNKTNNIYTAITSGSQRDVIIDAINQARITAAPTFNAAPAGADRGPFNIQNHYDMSPEKVKPKLEQLKDEINNANYSGMSGKDIYEWIENRFIEEFGKDFMIGFNLLQHVRGSVSGDDTDKAASNYEYVAIGQVFNDLVSGCVGFDEMYKINRENLYGNKNDMEIIDAIIAKHPERLTNRCLALITAEMQSVGINDNIGFGKYVDLLYEKSGKFATKEPGWNDYEDRWNSLLNMPANVQEMAFMHNGSLRDEPKNPYVLRVRDILIKLGAELGPDGLFLDPDGQPHVELNVELGGTDDLIDEFINDLEQHEKTLLESQERLEKNRELKDLIESYESASDSHSNNTAGSSIYS